MSNLLRPDYLSPPPVLPMPACPLCGARMRLVSIEPDLHFTNLDHRTFMCECGESVADVAARID
jgi:C4-type Zn-finger protein